MLICISCRYGVIGDGHRCTFEKMMEEGKLDLLAIQMDLRLSSNDDSEVNNVEYDDDLVYFQGLKTGPRRYYGGLLAYLPTVF